MIDILPSHFPRSIERGDENPFRLIGAPSQNQTEHHPDTS